MNGAARPYRRHLNDFLPQMNADQRGFRKTTVALNRDRHLYYKDETSRTNDKDLERGDSSPLSLLWRLVAKAGPRPAARRRKLDTPLAFDGDKSPAESADKSAHSKACGCGSAALCPSEFICG
jgi:hypothetical protein